MLDIKTFKDGNRLVIVLDGFGDEIPAMENAVQAFLSAIVPISSVRNVEASPVPVLQPEIPQLAEESKSESKTEEEASAVPAIFEDGPYQGLTPDEIIERNKQRGFSYLVSRANGGACQMSVPLMKASYDAVVKYLKNFKDTPAADYAQKLTDAQVVKFLTQYGPVIRPERRDEVMATSWNTIMTAPIDVQRKAVENCIICFQRLS